MNTSQFDNFIEDVFSKVRDGADLDWSEIVSKYNLPFANDTLRKGSSAKYFGSVYITEYLKWRNTNNSIDVVNDKDVENQINNDIQKYKKETTINKDGSYSSDILLKMSEEQEKDADFLLNAHGFDVVNWELISARNNIWNVYSKLDGVQVLYSSKITVKPISGISKQELEDFFQYLSQKYNPPVVKKSEIEKTGYMLEVPIVDLHIHKVGKIEDVDDEYNFEIAKKRFNYIIDDIIEESKPFFIEKIIFPIGNDYFNTDTVGYTTTAGTPQRNEGSWKEMFKQGVELLIDGITKLSKEINAPIQVFCVNGNHDFMTSFHALMCLKYHFANNEMVEVLDGSKPRKYIEYGNCLIGFAHGDKEKKRIFNIMQVEMREAWGRTKFAEIHQGHLHSEQVKEEGGVIVRHLPSVTGTDEWHFNQGYIGAVKKCQSFLWDKQKGLRFVINTTI